MIDEKGQSPTLRLGTERCQPPQTTLLFLSLLLVLFTFFFLLNSFFSFSFLFSFFFPSPTKSRYPLDVDTRVSIPGRSADAVGAAERPRWLVVMYLVFYSVQTTCSLAILYLYFICSIYCIYTEYLSICSTMYIITYLCDEVIIHDTANPKIARVQVF